MWDIRNSMVGTETFEPKHIVIATWKNVSFAGGIPSASRIVRSYKAVLRDNCDVLTFLFPDRPTRSSLF